MKLTAFLVCLLMLSEFPGIAQTTPDIDVWYPVYPVLQGKTHNPVARITVHSPAEGLPLEEVVVQMEEKQGGNSIAAVRGFYTGQDSAFNFQQSFATADTGDQVRLKGRIRLKEGNNYLWISLQPAERISPTDRFMVQVEAVVIDGKKHTLPSTDAPLLQAAIALRQHGEDSVDTYRIPGLVTTQKGTLIAVYDVRYNSSVDLQEDIDIGINRSTNGGETWQPMQIIMDRGTWGGLSDEANGVGGPFHPDRPQHRHDLGSGAVDSWLPRRAHLECFRPGLGSRRNRAVPAGKKRRRRPDVVRTH